MPLPVLLALLLGGASPSPPAAPCSDADIVGKYREERNKVAIAAYQPGASPETQGTRLAATFTGLDIAPVTQGISAIAAATVDWPLACTVPLVDASGPNLGAIKDGRVLYGAGFQRLTLIASRSPDRPAPNPAIRAGTFVGSASLISGPWRAGIWRFADGRSLLAAYRPGIDGEPIPLLRFGHPVLGVAYLPAPDTSGGNFTVLERLGQNRYRWLTVGWDESAIRTPAGAPKSNN